MKLQDVTWIALVACAGGCAQILGIEEETALRLTGLSISSGTLEPAFDPEHETYRVALAHPTSRVEITAMADDDTVQVAIGEMVAAPATPMAVGVPIGATTIAIEARTTSGVVRTYHVELDRADLDLAFAGPTYAVGAGMVYDLHAADLDGNGTVDFYYRTSDGGVGTIHNDGGDSYTTGAYYATTAVRDLTVGDIDGDGYQDLLISNDTFTIARGSPTGFQALFVRGPGPAGAVASGQLDDDSRADVIVANGPGWVTPLHGDGASMTVGPNWEVAPTTDEPHVLRLAQLDGVGPDEIVALDTNLQTISAAAYGVPTISMAPVPVAPAARPTELVTGDFDGDHHDDLAWLDPFARTITVATGYPAWTTRTFDIGAFARSLAVGDLDADGALDLAVLDGDDVIILRNSGDHDFEIRRFPQMASLPCSLAIGDFNGDGRDDLALPNGTSGVTLRLGVHR